MNHIDEFTYLVLYEIDTYIDAVEVVEVGSGERATFPFTFISGLPFAHGFSATLPAGPHSPAFNPSTPPVLVPPGSNGTEADYRRFVAQLAAAQTGFFFVTAPVLVALDHPGVSHIDYPIRLTIHQGDGIERYNTAGGNINFNA